MPSINGVLETCLYVEDLSRTQSFYQRLMGFTLLQGDDRFCALSVAKKQVLLLFTRGGTLAPVTLPGVSFPPTMAPAPRTLALPSQRMNSMPGVSVSRTWESPWKAP